MTSRRKRTLIAAALAAATACSDGVSSTPPPQQTAPPAAVPPARIDAQAMLERIKVLSSDEYEGRAPGTKGEDLTVRFLEEEFKKLGLKPGNTDGTYIQKVPLVGITASNSQPFTVTGGSQNQT